MWQISKDNRLERLIVYSFLAGNMVPAGELLFSGDRMRKCVFRYGRTWLSDSQSYDLSPIDLKRGIGPLQAERCHISFEDAMPDGWGRNILAHAYYDQFWGPAELLAATGSDRTGSLDIGFDTSGPSVWRPSQKPAYEILDKTCTLDELMRAAAKVEAGEASEREIHLLFDNAVSVGGARPKARYRDADGDWIAKFPAEDDAYSNAKIEALCLDIASLAGISVPDFKVASIGQSDVLMMKRFDRGMNGERYGYMSAATLAQQDPHAYGTNETYCSIATRARLAGVLPCEEELFKRMLLNCFLHNTDDHLRNHAFLRKDDTWSISPLYDVVPNRVPRLVMKPAEGFAPGMNPAECFESYGSFKIKNAVAIEIYETLVDAVNEVARLYDKYEVSSKDRAYLDRFWQYCFNPPCLSLGSTSSHT
jgi:serine/threonine-protein kinase HipA